MSDVVVLPEEFLQSVWERLTRVDEDSSRDQYIAVVDDISDMFHTLDPERFPIVDDEEGDNEEGDDE